MFCPPRSTLHVKKKKKVNSLLTGVASLCASNNFLHPKPLLITLILFCDMNIKKNQEKLFIKNYGWKKSQSLYLRLAQVILLGERAWAQ